MVVARDRESKARGKYWLDDTNKESGDKDSQKTDLKTSEEIELDWGAKK